MTRGSEVIQQGAMGHKLVKKFKDANIYTSPLNNLRIFHRTVKVNTFLESSLSYAAFELSTFKMRNNIFPKKYILCDVISISKWSELQKLFCNPHGI